AFLREVAGVDLPPAGEYATGLMFLPTDPDAAAQAVGVFEKYAERGGAEPGGIGRHHARHPAPHPAGVRRVEAAGSSEGPTPALLDALPSSRACGRWPGGTCRPRGSTPPA